MTRSFTYVPNFADNFHGVVLALWGTPARRRTSGLTCLMFGVFGAMIFWLAGMPPGMVAPAAFVLALAWAFFSTVAIGGQQAWLLTKRQRAIGPAEIRIGEHGLERSTRAASVTRGWDEITAMVETSRAFFLYEGAAPVFAIEKSAIGSAGEIGALRRFLAERLAGREAPSQRP